MPTRSSERDNESPWERRQRRAIALLLLLIPFGIPAGLFAPNLIAIMTSEDSFRGHDTGSDTARVELDHEPLRYRQDVPTIFEPPRTDTRELAKVLRPEPPENKEPLPPPFEFQAPDRDPEPDAGPRDPILVVDLPPPLEDEQIDEWEPDFFIVQLPGEGAYTQPPAVPEPNTGVLLGAGLIA